MHKTDRKAIAVHRGGGLQGADRQSKQAHTTALLGLAVSVDACKKHSSIPAQYAYVTAGWTKKTTGPEVATVESDPLIPVCLATTVVSAPDSLTVFFSISISGDSMTLDLHPAPDIPKIKAFKVRDPGSASQPAKEQQGSPGLLDIFRRHRQNRLRLLERLFSLEAWIWTVGSEVAVRSGSCASGTRSSVTKYICIMEKSIFTKKKNLDLDIPLWKHNNVLKH